MKRGVIPPDFDPDWYAATYRDVALTGLDPREHYRRFGSLLGRPAKAAPQSDRQQAPITPPLTVTAPAPPLVELSAVLPVTKPEPTAQSPAASPIIDRPTGFDPSSVLPKPAPTKVGGAGDAMFTLDDIAPTAGGSKQEGAAGRQALEGYRRLLRLQTASRGEGPEVSVSCGGQAFQTGPARIDNAWLVDGWRLRLMIAGGQSGQSGQSGGGGGRFAVRAFQAHPSAPGDLRMLGEGVELPASGPVFYDLELLHPLMPVLLELADADEATATFALLPFPSLLPGGLHNAELRSLKSELNPMDDCWALSETLLRQAVGDRSQGRFVTRIASTTNTDADSRPVFAAVEEWLSAVFGLAVESSYLPAEEGRRLLLPMNSVPTISALVSPISPIGSLPMVGPYLVAESEGYRPRWSVTLPAAHETRREIPTIQGAEDLNQVADVQVASVPLAIVLRPQRSPAIVRSKNSSAAAARLSILIHASAISIAERLAQSIRNKVAEVELLVATDSADPDLQAALDDASEAQGWRLVAASTTLREVAANIRNETLLTVSDRIDLGDGNALNVILNMLSEDEAAGSASCALLAEKIVKKDVVLEPASGGLFPTGQSVELGSGLLFGEPDVLQALPEMDYPVAANTFLFTAWRRKALVDLPAAPATAISSLEDMRVGLDLISAGYRNWCTTRVTARLAGPYEPRNDIDPVSSGYRLGPKLAEVFGRVTVVRELF